MTDISIELEEIKRDLEVFADPGREVLIEPDEALWEQDGETRRIKFSREHMGEVDPTVEYEGNTMSFRTFLASRDMADLRQLAEFMVRTMPVVDTYIETMATVEDEGSELTPALDLIRQKATTRLPYLATRLLFVRGEAGAGKTITLRQMTLQQARKIQKSGIGEPLFLYVDAQGRALARLEEAMAKELGALKAKFSDSAVAVLARRGLLVPIIDGFDELLGSGGYADAFSSLSAFVARLEGKGAVIASARSTFYYGVLRESAARFTTGSYKAETVEIRPWTKVQIAEYFKGQELVPEDQLGSLPEEDLLLLRKPFYAAHFAELINKGHSFDSSDSSSSLLDQLVAAFLEREVTKLLDKEGAPLLDYEGHREFITRLAEEMWWQENQGLDADTIKVHAELLAEERGLPPTVARSLIAKVESYAFLTPDRGRYTFEHQVFYGYFLARRLARYIKSGGADLRRFLGRSVMEPSLIDQCASFMADEDYGGADAVENICGVLRPTLSELVARENGGLLVAGLFRQLNYFAEGVRISNLVMRDEDFGRVHLKKAVFSNCDLQSIDLSRATLVDCSFVESYLREIKVARESTRLDGTEMVIGETIFGLVVLGEGRVDLPLKMAKVLQDLGAILPEYEEEGYSEDVQNRIDEVHRIAHIFERQYWVSPEDDDARALHRLSHWETIEQHLRRWNLLEERVITKSGPPVEMLRLAVPPAVLKQGALDPIGVPSSVRNFWEDIKTEQQGPSG